MTQTPDDRQPNEVIDLLRRVDERLDRIEGELAELKKRRRKRRLFATREERDAFFARSEEVGRRLQERITKIEAELAAKRKPA